MRDDSNWIQTYSGKQYWPTDPRAEDVDPVDIAHHLSNICRYTGACREFYSVAQHCVIMSHISQVCKEYMALAALLHDGAEAYTGDFARPVKREMSAMKELDALNERAVFERFGLLNLLPLSPVIAWADRVMLATERRDLMAPPARPWVSCENVKPLSVVIYPMSPSQAKTAWLKRFHELTRNQ